MISQPAKEPVILTPEEIERLLNAARKLRYYTILLTLYSMGLRLAEGLNLTISDIDAQRMRVHLRNYKGSKDRYVDLPLRTLKALDATGPLTGTQRFFFLRARRPCSGTRQLCL